MRATWEGQACPEGPNKQLLGTQGWQELDSSSFVFCINTSGEYILHLVERGFKRTVFTLSTSQLTSQNTHYIHTLSHSHTAVIHVGCTKQCTASIPESCKKHFMNQCTKTHVPGFQIRQQAGNEWESWESWPRPFLALLLWSGLLGPEWTFRKSSQHRRAPDTLFVLLGDKSM